VSDLKFFEKLRKNYYKNHKVHQKNTKTYLKICTVRHLYSGKPLAKTDKKIFKRTKPTKKYKICNSLDKKITKSVKIPLELAG
jgi:hypothetical protein